MKETSVSFQDDVRAELLARANEEGFYGPTALSAYSRHVILEHAGLSAPARVRGVAPIIAQPTSAEQRQRFEDYATLKHFPNVEAFALYAMGAITKKVPLTVDEDIAHARMVAERGPSEKR